MKWKRWLDSLLEPAQMRAWLPWCFLLAAFAVMFVTLSIIFARANRNAEMLQRRNPEVERHGGDKDQVSGARGPGGRKSRAGVPRQHKNLEMRVGNPGHQVRRSETPDHRIEMLRDEKRVHEA